MKRQHEGHDAEEEEEEEEERRVGRGRGEDGEDGAPKDKSAKILKEPITFAPFYDAKLGKKKGSYVDASGDRDGKATVGYREEIEPLFDAHYFLKVYSPSLDLVASFLGSYYDQNRFPGISDPKTEEQIDKYVKLLKELNEKIRENIAKCADLERKAVLYPLEVELCRHILVSLDIAKQRSVLLLYEIFSNFKRGSQGGIKSILSSNGFSPDVPYCVGTIVSTNLPYSVKRDSRVYFRIKLLSQRIADVKPAEVGIQTDTPNLELLSLSETLDNELVLSCRFQKGTRSNSIQLSFVINAKPALKSALQPEGAKFSFKVDPSDWVVVHTNDVQTSGTELTSILARMGFNHEETKTEFVPFPVVINKTLEYMIFKMGRRFLLSAPRKAGLASPSSTFKPDAAAETSSKTSSSDNDDDDDDDDSTGPRTEPVLSYNKDTEKAANDKTFSPQQRSQTLDRSIEKEAARTLNSMSSMSQSTSLLLSSSSAAAASTELLVSIPTLTKSSELEKDNGVFNKSFLTTYDISLIHRFYFAGKKDVSKHEIEMFLKAVFSLISLIKFSPQVTKLWEDGYIANFMEKDAASDLAKKFNASVLRFCFDHNDGLAVATPSGRHYLIPFDSKRKPEEIILESVEIDKILKVRTRKLGSMSVGKPDDDDPLCLLDRKYFVVEDKRNLFQCDHVVPQGREYTGYIVLK